MLLKRLSGKNTSSFVSQTYASVAMNISTDVSALQDEDASTKTSVNVDHTQLNQNDHFP